MQKSRAGVDTVEPTGARTNPVAHAKGAQYASTDKDNGKVTGSPAAVNPPPAGGGNGSGPTSRELQLEIQENRRQIAVLDDRVSSLDEHVSSLDERVSGLDERVSGLDERVSGLDERVSKLERTTRKQFRRHGREIQRIKELQLEMLGQMRAMMWIMGAIGGIVVAAILGGLLVPLVARITAPLVGG